MSPENSKPEWFQMADADDIALQSKSKRVIRIMALATPLLVLGAGLVFAQTQDSPSAVASGATSSTSPIALAPASTPLVSTPAASAPTAATPTTTTPATSTPATSIAVASAPVTPTPATSAPAPAVIEVSQNSPSVNLQNIPLKSGIKAPSGGGDDDATERSSDDD